MYTVYVATFFLILYGTIQDMYCTYYPHAYILILLEICKYGSRSESH